MKSRLNFSIFEDLWEKHLDKMFIGEERTQWLPFMKDFAKSMFIEGRKSAFKEMAKHDEEIAQLH